MNLPFSFEKPEDSPGFLLWQTTMIWQRQIKKALEIYNISHAGFVIMATLLWLSGTRYDTTQILIANQTKLDKMTVSKTLKKLVNLGLVNRIENESDTRAKNVSLTQQGKTILLKIIPIIEEIDSHFFSKVPKKLQTNLVEILAQLTSDDIKMQDQ